MVGGGTCGLAVVARLCEKCPGSIFTEDEHQRFHWLKSRGNKVNLIHQNNGRSKQRYQAPQTMKPEDILVIDQVSDNFLGQWDNQFRMCQIPFLRSPMFFHCDPVNIDGLYSYAHLNKRETTKDLKEIQHVVGKENSKHQLKKLVKKRQAKNPTQTNGNHDKAGLIDINMRDYRDYYRPSTKLFHDFCHEIIDRYNLHHVVVKDEVVNIEYTNIVVSDTNETGKGFVVTTASGKVYASKFCIVSSGHRGKINYPLNPEVDPQFPQGSCHTTHIFNGDVKFLEKELSLKKRRSIVIVGGGLTSAQLAHVAATNGIEDIHFVLRSTVKIKHFDFHLDWVTKYRNVKQSAFYMRDTDEEKWKMIQDAREGGSVNPEYYKLIMNHVKNGRMKLLTNTTIQKQVWNDSTKTWNVTLVNSKDSTVTNLEDVDYIYFATGITPDVASLPFLQPIVKEHHIKFVSGLPCLTDNLQWNETIPLFMTGRNASLRMGPVAPNLSGARLGAERIGWWIEELRNKKEFDWYPVCKYCSHEDLDDEQVLLELKLDEDDDSDESDSAFETKLKLASGQLNWFSLLEDLS